MTMQRPANVAVVGGSQLHKQPGPPPGFGHHHVEPEQSHEEMGVEPRDSECEGHSAVDSSFATSMSSTEHLKATLGIKCGGERDLLDESMDDACRGGTGVSDGVGGVGNCGIQRRLIDAFEEMALAEDDEDEESSQKKPRSGSCSPVFHTDAAMVDSGHQKPLPVVPSAPRKAAPKSTSITTAASTDNDNEGDIASSAAIISPTCVSEVDAPVPQQQQQHKKEEPKVAKDSTSSDHSKLASSEESNLRMDTSGGFDALEDAEEGKTGKGTHPPILTERPPSPSRSSSSGSQGSTSSGSTVAPIPVRAVDSPLRQQQEGGEPTSSGGDATQTPPRPPMSCPLITAAKCSSPPTVSQHPAMTRLNDFELHESLRLELSQPLINRVSFYGVVHDINKEAASMAAEDHSAFHRRTVEREHQQAAAAAAAALQAQANNKRNKKHHAATAVAPVIDENAGSTMADSALIDEEEWLVSVVANRSTEETSQIEKKSTAAASFAYAIGDAPDDTPPSEVVPASTSLSSAAAKPGVKQQLQQQPSSETTASGDKPNPIGEINGSSRTRLWKPSRSWWEARSGKNPWIDPENHVKRWRYLWPLIHYHKFLAKCIKKLKRHGVTDFLGPDTSPVISFLRHEIVAVSDHLAACSKFTSEQWLACLTYFDGWNDTSPEAQECLSVLVARQKLRSFAEPSDPRASPLVRKVLRSYGNNGDRYFGQGGGKGSDKRNGVNGRNKMNRGGGAPMAYHPSWAPRGGYPPYPPPTHHAAMQNYYYYHQMQQQYYAGMGAGAYGPPPSGGGTGSMMPPRQPRGKVKAGASGGLPPSSSMRNGRGKNGSKQHFSDGGVGAAYPPPGYGDQNYYPPPVPSSHPQPPMPLYPSPPEDQYYSHPSGHVVPQYMDASMYPTGAGSSSSYPPSSAAPPYSYHYNDVHPPLQHADHGHHDGYHPHEEFYPVENFDSEISYSQDEGDQWVQEEPPLSKDSPVYDDADHPMDAGMVPPSPYHCGGAPPMVSPSPGTYPLHSPMPHRGEGGEMSAETPTLQLQRSFDGSVAPSPYWGHLDQVALAVTMGDGSFIVDGTAPRGPGSSMMVMTPDTSRHGTPKGTPKRVSSKQQRRSKRNSNHGAKPLLFNPAIAHNQRVHGGRERFQPPSPATQFLMSPQQNFLPAAGFYAAYGGAEGSKTPPPTEDAAPADCPESSTSANKEEKDDAIPYTGTTEVDPRPLMSGAPCVSPIQEQDQK